MNEQIQIRSFGETNQVFGRHKIETLTQVTCYVMNWIEESSKAAKLWTNISYNFGKTSKSVAQNCSSFL